MLPSIGDSVAFYPDGSIVVLDNDYFILFQWWSMNNIGPFLQINNIRVFWLANTSSSSAIGGYYSCFAKKGDTVIVGTGKSDDGYGITLYSVKWK